MFFHPHSVEMYVAIAIAGLVPIACAYAVLIGRWKNELTFGGAAIVTLSYLIVFAVMVVLHFNIGQYPPSIMPFDQMLRLSVFTVALRFPGILLTIVTCIFVMIAWKCEAVRLASVFFSLFTQVLYLVNLAVVLSGGEILSL